MAPSIRSPAIPSSETLIVTARSRAEVLAHVARELAKPCPELDAAVVQAALRAREEAMSTDIGGGLAIPHAVLSELDTPRTLKVSFKHPVRWGDDGAEVDRCVVILVPPGHEDRHIELVAQAVKGETSQ